MNDCMREEGGAEYEWSWLVMVGGIFSNIMAFNLLYLQVLKIHKQLCKIDYNAIVIVVVVIVVVDL